jgi:hypothetical protein
MKMSGFFFLQWSAENGAISDTDKKHVNTIVNIAAREWQCTQYNLKLKMMIALKQ